MMQKGEGWRGVGGRVRLSGPMDEQPWVGEEGC